MLETVWGFKTGKEKGEQKTDFRKTALRFERLVEGFVFKHEN